MQLKQVGADCLICPPDFGDALTAFSLLRGTENLMLDLATDPDLILEKIREFVAAWREAQRSVI